MLRNARRVARRRIGGGGGDEFPRRRIEGRRLMTVARRPRRVRKVMRPLLQWYYNLNLLLLLLLLAPSETRSPPLPPSARPPLYSSSSSAACRPSPPPSVLRSRSNRMCERALSAYVSRPPMPSPRFPLPHRSPRSWQPLRSLRSPWSPWLAAYPTPRATGNATDYATSCAASFLCHRDLPRERALPRSGGPFIPRGVSATGGMRWNGAGGKSVLPERPKREHRRRAPRSSFRDRKF